MNSHTKQRIVQVIAALYIFLFSYTAMNKIMAIKQFQFTLAKSPLISEMAPFVAVLIPIIEMAIVLLLLLPQLRKIGLWSSLVLMALFTVYIGYMVIYIPHLPCSCGGVLKYLSWREHLMFNTFFVSLAVLAIILDKNEKYNGISNPFKSLRIIN